MANNVYFMDVEQLQTVVKKANIIEGDEHFKTMLNFYHDLGMIVKHRNTVILKAQWLIDLFRKLITIPSFDKMVGNLSFTLKCVFCPIVNIRNQISSVTEFRIDSSRVSRCSQNQQI